jgi:molybdate transport system substrate-binding protein
MTSAGIGDGQTLALLCAGAAKGLVEALLARFTENTGATVAARFGAVGAMREALLAGDPCDVLVVTAAMADALVAAGELHGDMRADLGRVRTGIAVRDGAPRPDIATPEALRAALLGADAVYFPDPERATAGIHFAAVMRQLGVHDTLASRCRTFPNGALAMAELARAGTPTSMGCTQITEIRYTPGIQLVGALPPAFELATVYTAAVARRSEQVPLADRFIALLTGPVSRELRVAGGFELD